MEHPVDLRALTGLAHHAPSLSGIATGGDLGGRRAAFLYWGSNQDRCTDAAVHGHSFFEACLVNKGRGWFEEEGQRREVRAGQAFLARPGRPHFIRSARTPAMGIVFWAFAFEETRGRPSTSAARGVDGLLSRFVESEKTIADETGGLAAAAWLLLSEAARSRPGRGRVIEALTAALLIETARVFCDRPAEAEPLPRAARSADEARSQRAERFIRDNLARPLGLEDVASHLYVSERHCRRLLRGLTGGSLRAYLTRLRVEEAQRLLLVEPAAAIKEIAARCGFADVSHFTQAFRKECGLTPGEYRRVEGALPAPPSGGRGLG